MFFFRKTPFSTEDESVIYRSQPQRMRFKSSSTIYIRRTLEDIHTTCHWTVQSNFVRTMREEYRRLTTKIKLQAQF